MRVPVDTRGYEKKAGTRITDTRQIWVRVRGEYLSTE